MSRHCPLSVVILATLLLVAMVSMSMPDHATKITLICFVVFWMGWDDATQRMVWKGGMSTRHYSTDVILMMMLLVLLTRTLLEGVQHRIGITVVS